MMKDYIKKLLYEIVEREQPPLDKWEIALFKFLNKKKNENKQITNSQIEEIIESFLRTLKIDVRLKKYYLKLYTLNYRPNGDYENLTYDQFIGPNKFGQERVPNIRSREYVSSKRPFKGSNLEGKWVTNRDGEFAYVVISYGWYPIYIYKNKVWYEVRDRYSPSTGKQMSQSRPSTVGDEISIQATPTEMNKIMHGELTYDDLIKNKINQLIADKNAYISKKIHNGRFIYDYNGEKINALVNYKISDLKLVGNQVIIEITIYNIKNGRGEIKEITENQEARKGAESFIKSQTSPRLIEYLSDINARYKSEHERVPETYTFNFKYQ